MQKVMGEEGDPTAVALIPQEGQLVVPHAAKGVGGGVVPGHILHHAPVVLEDGQRLDVCLQPAHALVDGAGAGCHVYTDNMHHSRLDRLSWAPLCERNAEVRCQATSSTTPRWCLIMDSAWMSACSPHTHLWLVQVQGVTYTLTTCATVVLIGFLGRLCAIAMLKCGAWPHICRNAPVVLDHGQRCMSVWISACSPHALVMA